MDPAFLSLDEVLEIHEQQIERYGGSSGLRDGGGLDNRATLECQTAAYFKGLPFKAAAEETDLEEALSNASQEMDFDQP